MTANLTGASSIGSTLSAVAAAPATYDSTGYAALTWVPVGEIKDIPAFGKSRNSNAFTPLASGVTQKYAGITDPGKLTLSFLSNTDDAGQIVLKTGLGSTSPVSIKIASQNGDVYYFRALVLSFKLAIGDANGLTMATCDLDITSTSAGVSHIEVLAA